MNNPSLPDMITSGLVITLSLDANLAAQAIAALGARSEFTPGVRNDHWLPVAMEAHDDEHSREAHDWLYTLPGVEFVDVVYVNFGGDESTQVAGARTPRPREPISRQLADQASALQVNHEH